MRKSWESWNCSACRRGGSAEISSICTNTWKEGAKKMQPGSFQVVPSDRTRGKLFTSFYKLFFTITWLESLTAFPCQKFYYSACPLFSFFFSFFLLTSRSHNATLSNTRSGPHLPLLKKVILVMCKHRADINIDGSYISIDIRERTELSDAKGSFIKKQRNFS